MAAVDKNMIEASIAEVIEVHPYRRIPGYQTAVAKMAVDFELVTDVAERLGIMGNESAVKLVWAKVEKARGE
jgi:hypothetical protein